MSEWSEPTAPDLGTPTDSPAGEAAIEVSTRDDGQDDEQTMRTPDVLGGTGGEQAGGAG